MTSESWVEAESENSLPPIESRVLEIIVLINFLYFIWEKGVISFRPRVMRAIPWDFRIEYASCVTSFKMHFFFRNIDPSKLVHRTLKERDIQEKESDTIEIMHPRESISQIGILLI